MERSPLEVKGWVSGLGLVMGPVMMILGGWALTTGIRGLTGNSEQPLGQRLLEYGPSCAVGLAIPAGFVFLLKGLKGLRGDAKPPG